MLLILTIFILFGFNQMAYSDLIINNNQYSVNVSLVDSRCDYLNSTQIEAHVRCMLLCQSVNCTSVNFTSQTNTCELYQVKPTLIKYNRLANLKIKYYLTNYLAIGESCLYGFQCRALDKTYCLQGKCTCQSKVQPGLQNEWTLNNTFIDSVTCLFLTFKYQYRYFYQETNSTFTYNFDNGINLVAPEDVYFSGDFTITVWIYVNNYMTWARIIDFGMGPGNNNVVFTIWDGVNPKPTLAFYANYVELPYCTSSQIINLNEWTYLAAVLSGNTAQIYMNQTLVANCTSLYVFNLNRTSNLIGKSNWPNDGYTSARMSRLRIYNRSLTPSEIYTDSITL